MTPAGLPLRDVHLPPAPPWWPLAPGWWAVLAAVLVLATVVLAWQVRRHRRRRAVADLFDATLAAAPDAAARVAAISELLRRAAIRIDPASRTLDGDAWLRFLDRSLPRPVFQPGGALLRDGAFRRDPDPVEVEALRVLARSRFLAWMAR